MHPQSSSPPPQIPILHPHHSSHASLPCLASSRESHPSSQSKSTRRRRRRPINRTTDLDIPYAIHLPPHLFYRATFTTTCHCLLPTYHSTGLDTQHNSRVPYGGCRWHCYRQAQQTNVSFPSYHAALSRYGLQLPRTCNNALVCTIHAAQPGSASALWLV